jgi:hypothetical protein
LDGPLFKLGAITGDTIAPVRHANAFQIERTTGADRLRISVEEAPISLLWNLALPLGAPFFVLYILHTSRCGNQLGRYQSPAIQFDAVNGFMAEFCEFLTEDGRHDLWLHSPKADATLVWDRHDIIYAYGPLEQFREVLNERLQEAQVDGPPNPHAHMYHAQHDEAERRILRYFQWFRSPLLRGDQQFAEEEY